jgi:integrase
MTSMSYKSKTVNDVAEIWINRCMLEGLERATVRAYRSHHHLHIKPRIGDRDIVSLTVPELVEFRDELLADSSPAMVKKVVGSLRSIFAEAMERGMVDRNIARDFKLPKSSRHDPDKIIPKKVQIKLLLEKVPDRYKAFFYTAVFSGLRASELRGLRWSNVDLDTKVIRVREKADRFGEFGNPKSKTSRRDVPMGPMLEQVLLEWKTVCPEGEHGLVFPNGKGNVENHSNIYNRMFSPLMHECGLVDGVGRRLFSFHALRHAAASLFIDQGMSMKRVQALMGHSSITMTYDVYGHLFDDLEADLENMAQIEKNLLSV